MRSTIIVAVMAYLPTVLFAGEYNVSPSGDDRNEGSQSRPFKTISAAAQIAQPGDVITVHEGIYRERINPPRGGTSDEKRIVYQAAAGQNVVIKGSERVTGWEQVEKDVWVVRLPNHFFGGFNPYADVINGAWYEAKQRYTTGAVYVNGHWLRQAARKADIFEVDIDENAAEELLNISLIMPQGDKTAPAAAVNFSAKSSKASTFKLPDGKSYVGRMKNNDWLAYEKVNFGTRADFIFLEVASPEYPSMVEIRRDSPEGDLLGVCEINITAEWTHFQRFRTRIKPTSGMQKIVLVFKSLPKEQFVDRDAAYWFADVDEEKTTIWAQFKGIDPNQEMVEINVRQSVFYPDKPGRNYITVRGFTLEQASTPWASPTAEQIGLIGTHWSKGWIIENNTIRYSTCVGATLGKYGDDIDHTYDYHLTIKRAMENGWNRDTIGSHIVCGNHIVHCGQAGIVGSLGAIFSTISRNEIHEIRQNHQYGGCETAGIKIHAAIGTLIQDNHIYRCEHWGGIWLDWMAQGARVTGNLLHDNSQDMMFEVNHGPYLVDNNLLLSEKHVTEASGGGAFVHNLWFGGINIWPNLERRQTPFFKPHSTELVGKSAVNQNDDTYLNNVFIGPQGTSAYDEHGFRIAAAGNLFLAGAKPSANDKEMWIEEDFNPDVKLFQENGKWWLEMKVYPHWKTKANRLLVSSEQLGKSAVSGVAFESRDGTAYRIDTDYFGRKRSPGNPSPGPFCLNEEKTLRLNVWPKQ